MWIWTGVAFVAGAAVAVNAAAILCLTFLKRETHGLTPPAISSSPMPHARLEFCSGRFSRQQHSSRAGTPDKPESLGPAAARCTLCSCKSRWSRWRQGTVQLSIAVPCNTSLRLCSYPAAARAKSSSNGAAAAAAHAAARGRVSAGGAQQAPAADMGNDTAISVKAQDATRQPAAAVPRGSSAGAGGQVPAGMAAESGAGGGQSNGALHQPVQALPAGAQPLAAAATDVSSNGGGTGGGGVAMLPFPKLWVHYPCQSCGCIACCCPAPTWHPTLRHTCTGAAYCDMPTSCAAASEASQPTARSSILISPI